MSDNITPMMRQYRRIKAELPQGVILLFRLGDFYEMFFEDAREIAPVLDITLTRRNGVPMCGVPYHAIDSYLAKLVKAGKKAAIVEQMEDPAKAKGLVKREVDRIVTAGSATTDEMLEAGRNNFMTAVFRTGTATGCAVLDISTGLFWGEEFENPAQFKDSLMRTMPSECLVVSGQKDDHEIADILKTTFRGQLTVCEDWTFEYETARDTLIRHFGVQSLEGFGCEGRKAVAGAAGGLIYYVKNGLRRNADHIRGFHLRSQSDFLVLDEATCNNLDIVSSRGSRTDASLLRVLDVTRTAMGARKLRDWLVRPLARLEAINARLHAVELLCGDRAALADIRNLFGGVRDLERLIARIGSSSGNARDLAAIGQSLAVLPAIKEKTAKFKEGVLKDIADEIAPQPSLVELVGKAIVDEPAFGVKEGGIIRNGYNTELDELKNIGVTGKKWLAEYQVREQERTGIKTLKVRHNNVFGYYIEISRGQADRAPADYTRKQTVVNAERFITNELKEYENRIIGAQERANALEYECFIRVRDAVSAATAEIQSTADALARLDVLAAFADRAAAFNYARPAITDDDVLIIKDGRHPVVEQMPDAERFVPNDTKLDCAQNQLVIITGPNMAGKSTYIRQVALIVIMAHAGSFVPAARAQVCLVDRVFTRVGAGDDLARGRSTFMVEMQETANILNTATSKSLIVLDEIGRGTSTFDGISIAWAVAEFLHNRIKAKTLFATHYHELTDLAMTMPGIKNYNVLVREHKDAVVFLRKIAPGAADKSYGIQVARLAGLPPDVVERSKEILANLEEGELGESGQPKIAMRRPRKGKENGGQMLLFGG